MSPAPVAPGYSQQEWRDNNPGYPLSALRLRHIEAGIAADEAFTLAVEEWLIDQKGEPGGLATLGEDGKVSSPLPDVVVSASQLLVSIKDHGAVSGEDCTTAIKAAQKEAQELPGNYGVFFPAGTWLYSTALVQEVPWKGVPRKSILKQGSPFTYSLGAAAIQNKGYAHTYNASTAGTVAIEGIDFIFKNSESAEHTGIGLANVAGGQLVDSHLSTEGSGKITLLDLFAAARNLYLDVRSVNSTGAAHGGACWIRNACEPTSEATARENATEHITLSDNCYFSTNTGDEAISVFSSGGMVRHIRPHGTVEAPGGAVSHAHIASTILETASGANPYAAVEDVLWEGMTFIDTTGKLSAGHPLLVFGLEADAGLEHTRLQGIRHKDCTFIVSSPTAAVASLNIPNNYEGGTSGNAAINPTIIATGSAGAVVGVKGFPIVSNVVTRGNVTPTTEGCGETQNGSFIQGETLEEVQAKATAGNPPGTQCPYVLISGGVLLDMEVVTA